MLRTHRFEALPELGRGPDGRPIRLGGFSGLCFEGHGPRGELRFLTHTDRGPNPDARPGANGETLRPFALPAFQPEWVRFELEDREGARARIVERIPLVGPDGKALSGIPNLRGRDETPVDLEERELAFDAAGVDPEGIVPDGSGGYLMAEEYGPSLLRFTAQGKLVKRYAPGSGLPASYAKRRLNRGFEGIARDGDRVFLFLQAALKGEELTRILEFDLAGERSTAEYLYALEGDGADRLGDATALGGGEFLVIEQDDRAGRDSIHKIHRIALGEPGAPVGKRLVADLVKAGLHTEEKVEGIAVVGGGRLAVICDDDFSLGNPEGGPLLALLPY